MHVFIQCTDQQIPVEPQQESFTGAPTPGMEWHSSPCSVCDGGEGQSVDENYLLLPPSSMPLLDTYYSDVDMESYQNQLLQNPPTTGSLPLPPSLSPPLPPSPLALENYCYYCMQDQDPNAVWSSSLFPAGLGISMNTTTDPVEEIGDVPVTYQEDEYDHPHDALRSFTDKQCVGGGYGGSTSLPSFPCSSLDESNFKVVRLSAEERREKINRYLKKKHHRNFAKKIKYACRKTLADRRPRVRGRFAKNEENDQDEEDEMLVITEEDPYSDMFGNLNSLILNYPLESWMD